MLLRIKGLFHRFDYDIEIQDGEIVTITGANGFGKSTIINIINAIGNSNIRFFFQLEFEQIYVKKEEDGSPFVLRKKDSQLIFNNQTLDFREALYFSRGIPLERIITRRNAKQTDLESIVEQKKIYDTLMHNMKELVSGVRLIREQRIIIETEEDEEQREAVERIPEKLALEIQNASNVYANISNELDGS